MLRRVGRAAPLGGPAVDCCAPVAASPPVEPTCSSCSTETEVLSELANGKASALLPWRRCVSLCVLYIAPGGIRVAVQCDAPWCYCILKSIIRQNDRGAVSALLKPHNHGGSGGLGGHRPIGLR